jgi:hypothetical protein
MWSRFFVCLPVPFFFLHFFGGMLLATTPNSTSLDEDISLASSKKLYQNIQFKFKFRIYRK